MSGFFALRRSTFMADRDYNPIGYKILLELIVKCRCKLVVDIPIHFEDRRFSFSYARKQPIIRQFIGVVAACSVGAIVNYCITMSLWEVLHYKQKVAIIGVAAGTVFNFAASRFLIFRSKHIRNGSR